MSPNIVIQFQTKREQYKFTPSSGSKVLIDSDSSKVYLYCRGGSEYEYVKVELGGRWNQVESRYELPRLYYVVKDLKEKYPGSQVSNSVDLILLDNFGFGGSDPMLAPILDHPSWDLLRHYQRESAQWMSINPHSGGLLALQPGLGKTATTIVAAEGSGLEKKLVICPLALLGTWRDELAKWGKGESWSVHHGTGPSGSRWTIANYDTVVGRLDQYRRDWDLIVCDESVLLKSRDTQRSKAILKLRESTRKMWLLSGSPTTRYPDDLYMQFHIVDPKAFKSYWRFVGWTCEVDRSVWGSTILGPKPGVSFRDVFKDMMHVELLEETIGLPQHIPIQIDVELEGEQKKVYVDLLLAFRSVLNGAELTAANKIAQLIRLHQSLSGLSNFPSLRSDKSSKAEALVDLLEARSFGLPAIVFVHYRESAIALNSLLTARFPNIRKALILGGQGDIDVQSQKFQKGELDLLILSLGVGKYGLTLDHAETIIYYDKTFDGDAYKQSLYRTRQKPVLVVSLRCPGTVDELIELNLSGKMKSMSQITNEDLKYMLQNLGG